jgi:hypothetical protein
MLVGAAAVGPHTPASRDWMALTAVAIMAVIPVRTPADMILAFRRKKTERRKNETSTEAREKDEH